MSHDSCIIIAALPTSAGPYIMWQCCMVEFVILQGYNTFQAIMVTDGNNSFAIFIYRCGDLQWDDNAVIGFGASSEFASNHWLSGTPNVTSIACLNTPDNPFFILLYKLTESRYGKPSYPCNNMHVFSTKTYYITLSWQISLVQWWCSHVATKKSICLFDLHQRMQLRRTCNYWQLRFYKS